MGATEVRKKDLTHLGKNFCQRLLNHHINELQVTHHHHDHSYGVHDYIAAGAKMIVLDTAKQYWSKVPGIKFDSYS